MDEFDGALGFSGIGNEVAVPATAKHPGFLLPQE